MKNNDWYFGMKNSVTNPIVTVDCIILTSNGKYIIKETTISIGSIKPFLLGHSVLPIVY